MAKSLLTQVKDVVNEEKRKGKIIQYVELLDLLPNLFVPVEVDMEEIQNAILSSIQKNSDKNPFNVLLHMFGFCVVKETKIRYIKKDNEKNRRLRQFLSFDLEKMREKVSEYANEVAKYEAQRREKEAEMIANIGRANRQIESLNKSIALLKAQHEEKVNNILIGLQDLISNLDQESDKKFYESLTELIGDCDVEICWMAQNEKDSKFNFQYVKKIKDNVVAKQVKQTNFYVSKPAFLKNGDTILKGYVYVLETEEEI